MNGALELATLGMGCFWCGEASFSNVEGIESTRVGYMGGKTDNPTYEEVCSGRSGHIEVIEIRFDTSKITFQNLLEYFWNCHNPAESREWKGDYGSQYGSVIFFNTEEQKAQAEGSKRRVQASGRFRGPITTLILPASKFWVAEGHHQRYIAKLNEPRIISGLD